MGNTYWNGSAYGQELNYIPYIKVKLDSTSFTYTTSSGGGGGSRAAEVPSDPPSGPGIEGTTKTGFKDIQLTIQVGSEEHTTNCPAGQSSITICYEKQYSGSVLAR